jgi:phosphate transport system substrate-binding protein
MNHYTMIRGARVAIAALVLGGAIAGCAPQSRRTKAITIKGSDTMVILGQRWAESYMAAHPGSVIQVTGGGSGTGIAALINGTTDICQASRPMKDEEKNQAAQTYGQPPVETVVARDGVAIYVAESNPVQSLTMEQLKGIFTGAITNWKQVGGPDSPIVTYGRENNSGTYVFFKEHVLANGDFAAAVQTLPGTAAVVNAVGADARGIGYGGGAYAKGVRECAVKADDASPAVLPSKENVMNGSYPLSRPLYFYTAKAPAGALQEFITWVLSTDGQNIVSQVGYFPVQ